jgi:hypothetical protein
VVDGRVLGRVVLVVGVCAAVLVSLVQGALARPNGSSAAAFPDAIFTSMG